MQETVAGSYGFAFLAFEFGPGGRLLYVANTQRADIVEAMREFISSTERRFAEHVPDEELSPAREAFQKWLALQKHRVAWITDEQEAMLLNAFIAGAEYAKENP